MGSGFAGAKAAEENWSDGYNTGGGLFFYGSFIKLSCRLYMWNSCALTGIFSFGLDIFPSSFVLKSTS